MIIIDITNQSELVKAKKGWAASKIGGFVADVEGEVEKEIIKHLQEAFQEQGICANIVSVGGINVRSALQVCAPEKSIANGEKGEA